MELKGQFIILSGSKDRLISLDELSPELQTGIEHLMQIVQKEGYEFLYATEEDGLCSHFDWIQNIDPIIILGSIAREQGDNIAANIIAVDGRFRVLGGHCNHKFLVKYINQLDGPDIEFYINLCSDLTSLIASNGELTRTIQTTAFNTNPDIEALPQEIKEKVYKFVKDAQVSGCQYYPIVNDGISSLFRSIPNIGIIAVIGAMRKKSDDGHLIQCAFAVDGMNRLLAAPLHIDMGVSVLGQINEDMEIIIDGLFDFRKHEPIYRYMRTIERQSEEYVGWSTISPLE